MKDDIAGCKGATLSGLGEVGTNGSLNDTD